MELIRGLHNIRPAQRGCVATIGNFDGVHRGHQAVLDQVKGEAARLGLPSVVMVFEPQPQEYFTPEGPPPRLTRLREKCELFAGYGIDRLFCVRFDERLAGYSAERFVEELLIRGLGVRHLVVGDDFRFGSGRAGDFALLRRMGLAHGFDVVHADTCVVDGARVSSTRVREALAAGDLAAARRLLGRGFSISGRVVRGQERGRSMGFPTANIHLHRAVSPVLGIFAARVRGLDGEPRPGVAYVGNRPIIADERCLLEVHVFDYHGDCYGRYLQVELVAKLRDDRRFESFDDLARQIEQDVQAAHRALEAAAPDFHAAAKDLT